MQLEHRTIFGTRGIPLVFLLACLATAWLLSIPAHATVTSCEGDKQKVNCGEQPKDGDECSVTKETLDGDVIPLDGTVVVTGNHAACVWGLRTDSGDIQVTPSASIKVPWNASMHPKVKPDSELVTVSSARYAEAVAAFKSAFQEAESARRRLARLRPRDKKPDPIDCLFHPWHPGCDIWNSAAQKHTAAIQEGLHPTFSLGQVDSNLRLAINPWTAGAIAWVVGKSLDYLWEVGDCLVEADGPDGRGLEGSDGMEKFGDCFVHPDGDSKSVIGGGGNQSGGTDGHQWTRWLNRDAPGGVGDYETLRNFVEQGQACRTPVGIECRTREGVSWQDAGQVYSCDVSQGGVCRNDRQPQGARCKDYEVRFLCPQS